MTRINLNITRETAEEIINILANEEYRGSYTDYDAEKDPNLATEFIINGHTLSSISNQTNHVVIDGHYVNASKTGIVIYKGQTMSNINWCLRKLGF